MSFRKWYFAANATALRDAFDLIHVAVVSARQNTGLVPFCIIEDTDHCDRVAANVEKLIASGVTIVLRNAEVFPMVQNAYGAAAAKAYNGHWLRTDIPYIEREDEFVLYTDIDVMFRADVSDNDLRPKFIACGPEHKQDDWSYFNTGVLVMNVPSMRATRPEFVEVIREHMPRAAPYDDQTMYNICYRDRYDRLPLEWNWKPYWGYNAHAKIVHFHGPKPNIAKHLREGGTVPGMPIYREMFDRDREGYALHIAEFDRYLAVPLAGR
ncbi:hypothetical protein PMNALOAF_2578 [Methylobacterium adhaesivum]|uniref:Glycosyltransferase n=1 Tax=Methylobacterium adhaesivum TaxID=333297 RepID=A0ABT8BEF7_9HYPH|nr:glycosyltransferase [Methylobacterium adhaesivum]MDN3590502.1 glycosyltransferase [Methylobacterium adhaesivum]GJD31324.1 hypothetical protein PMNALOAF_2578 [Methylobacterium adhaesivum]